MHGLWNWISGIIFPTRCLGCTAYDTPLCARCTADLPFRRQEWRDPHAAIDRLFVAGPADHDLLLRAIYALKYGGTRGMAAPLADYLVTALARHGLTAQSFSGNPLLVPVPLFIRRERERGFNQSALLAGHLAARLALEHAPEALQRTRHTGSQVKTASRWERLENIQGAFAVTCPDLVAGRHIVLVDDVCTTGATLDACARVLKDAGAQSVLAIALARG